jgi:hypothetical protein
MIVVLCGDGVGGWQRRACANVAVRGPPKWQLPIAKDTRSKKKWNVGEIIDDNMRQC